MADEVNAVGNPGAEGAAPTGAAAAATSPVAASAPAGDGTPPAGGTAITPPAGDAAPKADADLKADAKAEPKAADAPIDFKATIAEAKLPEGVVLDDAVVTAASELFGKLGLNAEQASELASFYASQQVVAAQRNAQAWQDQQEAWRTEAKADKAITAELTADAKGFFGRLSPESRQLLEGYGFTNNPHLIKDFGRLARAIKDDNFAAGGAARANGTFNPASLYPNSDHAA